MWLVALYAEVSVACAVGSEDVAIHGEPLSRFHLDAVLAGAAAFDSITHAAPPSGDDFEVEPDGMVARVPRLPPCMPAPRR